MKTSDLELVKLFQARVAEGAIGPSAMRNQGNTGVVRRARQYLAVMNLSDFSSFTESLFQRALDKHTEQLRRRLPARARHWGTARKALNLFLRDVLYHRYLSKHYKFQRVERWLELPLDRFVAEGIMTSTIGALPRWRGIVHVAPEESAIYQRAARRIARASGIAPIHLDVYWWREIGRRNGKDT
jgi:hypothetical protein